MDLFLNAYIQPADHHNLPLLHELCWYLDLAFGSKVSALNSVAFDRYNSLPLQDLLVFFLIMICILEILIELMHSLITLFQRNHAVLALTSVKGDLWLMNKYLVEVNGKKEQRPQRSVFIQISESCPGTWPLKATFFHISYISTFDLVLMHRT